MENSIDLAIVQGVLEVLLLHIMVKVVVETGIIDSVYINVAVGSGKWFGKERIVPFGVGCVGRVKIL